MLQGAHLSDGGLDHTFRGLSLIDDLCGGVLADNGRRNNGRLFIGSSLGHSVRRVDSLDLSHCVYTRMSTRREKAKRLLTNDCLAVGLDQGLSLVVHFSSEPDASVGGLETT